MTGLEFRLVNADLTPGLATFFRHLVEGGGEKDFHPHDLTDDAAREICERPTSDLYYVAVDTSKVLAYGILRGWEDGYAVPSLGIAVHREARRSGLSRAFLEFLHVAARRRGAEKVRLKVHPSNMAARRLYESSGYVFEDYLEDGQDVGYLTLGTGRSST